MCEFVSGTLTKPTKKLDFPEFYAIKFNGF